jgi:hypothetical protein
MNRFEQLIEYVINDEEAKARELFHDIVVEKSRQIYENIMAEEAEELEEAAEEELEEGMEEVEEGMEEVEEGMGGDASDDLIDDVEMEEESAMNMAAEGDEEMGSDNDEPDMDNMGGPSDHDADNEPATKSDVMNLEDKLDQLMAEFEDLMGSDDMGDGDGFGPDEGGDAIEMDDTDEMEPGMMEAVSLKAAPKPVTSEEGGVNKKSTYAANSGQAGMASRPVHTGAGEGGRHDTSAYSNNTKDLIGKVGNTPAQGTQKPSAAPKPKMGAGSEGQNNKSPLPTGRRG